MFLKTFFIPLFPDRIISFPNKQDGKCCSARWLTFHFALNSWLEWKCSNLFCWGICIAKEKGKDKARKYELVIFQWAIGERWSEEILSRLLYRGINNTWTARYAVHLSGETREGKRSIKKSNESNQLIRPQSQIINPWLAISNYFLMACLTDHFGQLHINPTEFNSL